MNKYHVTYSDGSERYYETLLQAEIEIEETVLGCNFAATVDSIEKAGEVVEATWHLSLLKRPV